MTPTTTTVALALAWLACGVVTAVLLAQRGQAIPTVAAAVAAWPVLIPLLTDAPAPRGPNGARIAAAFAALEAALREPAAVGVVTPHDVARLRDALHRADARLAVVDRLLSDDALATDPVAARLRDGREQAQQGIEALLRGVLQLRVQVGLLALAGDTLPVRDRMQELTARVRALEELALT